MDREELPHSILAPVEANEARPFYSYNSIETLSETPYNTEIIELYHCFKLSADFLFNSGDSNTSNTSNMDNTGSDYIGHHGLFSKGDAAGSESGWLVGQCE